MNENQAAGSYISNITMVDEDENTMVMCELLEDGGGRIALNETTLVAGEKNTDYERELSHVIDISLKCCDQLEACIKKKFNISVKGETYGIVHVLLQEWLSSVTWRTWLIYEEHQ